MKQSIFTKSYHALTLCESNTGSARLSLGFVQLFISFCLGGSKHDITASIKKSCFKEYLTHMDKENICGNLPHRTRIGYLATEQSDATMQDSTNAPGVNNRSAAREATDSRHHCLHLLRHIYQESSAIRSSSPSTESVPVRPRAVAPRHQGNSEAGCTPFRVARHTERLPNLGTGLTGLPAFQSLPPHGYSSG
jgi:hypothetical protein